MSGLYGAIVGEGWATLAPSVQRLHGGGGRAVGTFCVRRGASIFARFLAWLLRMPRAAEAVSVTLDVLSEVSDERWTRAFGETRVVTRQWLRDGLLVEAFGLVQCLFRLRAVAGALVFEQVGACIGGHRFVVPLPRLLAPAVEGRAEGNGDGVHVDVAIRAPIVGLLVQYSGTVRTIDRPLPDAEAA